MKAVLLAGVWLALLMAWSEGAEALQYQLADLGSGTARAINDSGQVVGDNGHGRALLWQNGITYELGVLPIPGYISSWANDINDIGQVVGGCCDSYSISHSHAFVWQNGAMRDLGVGIAAAINNSGDVAGKDNYGHAVMWHNGVVQYLATLPDSYGSWANGINDAGQVVGGSVYSPTSGAYRHAVLWQNGVAQDLGVLPGCYRSEAWAINSRGQVVGNCHDSSGYSHAFLWHNGVMQELAIPQGGFQAWAYGMNDQGQVVGWFSDPSGYACACVWQDGVAQALDRLPGSSDTAIAYAISGSGQVVGVCQTSFWQACLWSPVPEPSSLLALLCGIGASGGAALRKRR